VVNNKKKIKKVNQNGFTLVEILVAMMIFGAIVGGVVLFGIRSIEAHTKSQAMQNALENARFAMDSLSRQARISSGINPAGKSQEVFFIDNASGNSYCYFFDMTNGPALRVMIGDGTEVECSEIVSAAEDVVGDHTDPNSKIGISGSFDVKETDLNTNERGLLRVNMEVTYNGALGVQGADSRTIQSTVSLRDY